MRERQRLCSGAGPQILEERGHGTTFIETAIGGAASKAVGEIAKGQRTRSNPGANENGRGTFHKARGKGSSI